MPVVSGRVQRFLDREHVCYELVPHVTDFTSLETSEHTHTPGRAFAKAVIVVADDRVVMCVVCADHIVELPRVGRTLNTSDVHLVSEFRLRRIFPDCERGAIPPFGNLYGLPVFASQRLMRNHTITCNAGSHEMAIRISTEDYRRLVRPAVLDFSHHV